jgi:O-antigen/teichoic acid export membrane protein
MDARGPSERSQLKNVLSRNLTVSVAAKVLYMVTRVFVPPVVLAYVSMEEYGIWAACFIVIGYLGMSAFGISGAYVRYAADLQARGETRRIGELISTGLAASLALSLAGLAVVWCVLPWALGALDIPAHLTRTATVLILGTTATFMLDLNLGAFAYVLQGLQRLAQQNAVWVVSFLMETVLIVVFLHHGLGVYALLLAFVCRYLLATSLNVYMCFRALPGLRLGPRQISREMLRLFYGYGAMVQVSALLGTFLYSVEKVLAGFFVNIRATGLFDIGEKLPMMTSQVFASMNESFLPAMAHLGTLDRRDEITKLYLKGARYTHMITGMAMGFLAAFTGPLLTAWLGPRQDLTELALIMTVFCLPYQIHILTGPASMYHRGAGHARRELVYFTLQLVLVALTVGLGFWHWGRQLEVIVGGVAVSMVTSALVYIYYSNHFVAVSAGRFSVSALLPGLVPYAWAGVVRLLASPVVVWAGTDRLSLLLLLAMAGLVYAVAAGATLFFGFCPWEEREFLRRQLSHTVRSLVPGRRPN